MRYKMLSASRQIWAGVALGVLSAAPGVAAAQNNDIAIAQQPLILGSTNVPGNLFLVPSFEFPTFITQTHVDSFVPGKEYVGYFNPTNCYKYQLSDQVGGDTVTAETTRHWKPVANTTPEGDVEYACPGDGNDQWSGNFLNWATTQNVDPFRQALMGGYRFKDTAEETWLQKAKSTTQNGPDFFPDKQITDTDVIGDVTPFEGASRMDIRIGGIGNEHPTDPDGDPDEDRVTSPMRFWLDGSGNRNSAQAHYDPANGEDANDNPQTDAERNDEIINGNAFDAEVRVEVCNPEAGGTIDQDLCHPYDNNNYKPEGLIQEFARLDNEEGFLRYSVASYLNDPGELRDGGVIRAEQKFVGPQRIDPATGESVANPNQEWDEDTGVLIENPDASLATETSNRYNDVSINRSGVINYIGSAGQTNTNEYKTFDSLSELYYTVSRYLRNLDPVDAYTNLPGNTNVDPARALDDFPAADETDDPIAPYTCAANAGLTIGDVFTHHDKNVPGNSLSNSEPSTWSELTNDLNNNGLDVVELTNKVGELEDGLSNTLGENIFTGRQNSAHIAGLAYDMHTRDQRSDLDGSQRLSTYAIDVFENQQLVPETENQYYLAAKYGGFDVEDLPDVDNMGEFDPLSRTDPLPTAAWKDGDVEAGGTTYEDRPQNFFLANEPDKVADSLETAFEDLAAEAVSSSAALAANSTSAGSDTLLYQARFNSRDWSGNVVARELDADGNLTGGTAWQAKNGIPSAANRTVYTIDGNDDLSEVTRDEDGQPGGLTNDQWNDLNSDNVLADYLLFGASDKEVRNGGSLRDRSRTVLGDIVNSTPAVASGGNFGYSVFPDIGDDYRSFLSNKRDEDEMLFVGANDGMLHAFNAAATGGDESFTFVPDAVFGELPSLGDTSYRHQYYVDGRVTVADAYWGGTWGEAVVASTGGGPKQDVPAVFALDVTRTSAATAPQGALWELTGSDTDELGHVLGNIDIVRLPTDNFAAVFGNGYNSTNDQASLFIVPLSDASNRTVLTTGAGSTSNPNGLGGVSTVDVDGDGFVERVYAGDLQGNLWRFDVSSSDTSNWSSSKLFKAEGPNNNPQPITAAPKVTPHSSTSVSMNVLFGTGRLFSEGDGVVGPDPQVQSFYAIQDERGNTNQVPSRSSSQFNLVEQTIDEQDTSVTPPTREFSDNSVNVNTNDGWFIDLIVNDNTSNAAGERVVDTPIVVGNRVFFLSQIPDDSVCAFGGESWLFEMQAESGGVTQTTLPGLSDAGKGAKRFGQGTTGLTKLGNSGDVTIAISGAGSQTDDADDELPPEVLLQDVPGGGSSISGRQSWRQIE